MTGEDDNVYWLMLNQFISQTFTNIVVVAILSLLEWKAQTGRFIIWYMRQTNWHMLARALGDFLVMFFTFSMVFLCTLFVLVMWPTRKTCNTLWCTRERDYKTSYWHCTAFQRFFSRQCFFDFCCYCCCCCCCCCYYCCCFVIVVVVVVVVF